MADSNSQPPRCSCGFYGSAQTMGLCSKCYREQKGSSNAASCGEQQQRTPSTGSTNTSNITESDHSANATEVLSQALTQVQTARPTTNCPASVTQQQSQDTTDSTSNALASSSSSLPTASNNKKSEEKALSTTLSQGTKRKLDETDNDEQEPDPPVQQNKKRCCKCRCKLELHVRAVGKCKCGYTFCPLHRLPEQHECNYNHKEFGREEARGKMVSPKKHLGTSLKRIDHDS